jgi:hypothetical protein
VTAALVVQHAMRMRRVVLSSLACPAVQHFFQPSFQRHEFRRNVIEHEMCFDFAHVFCMKYLILRRIARDMTTICIGCYVKFSADLHEP